MKSNTVDYNHVTLRGHERRTVEFLASQGFRIRLLPIIDLPGIKTPDMLMNGEPWEMKTFSRVRWRTVERSFHHAMKQANNVVFDLRGLKNENQENALRMLVKAFSHSHSAKAMLVITKEEKILSYKK